MSFGRPVETETDEPRFDRETVLSPGRFPNVVTTTDGTVLATHSRYDTRDPETDDFCLLVRRSDDGGDTWGSPIEVGDGIHGGGVTVDETTGDILAFTHPEHPPRDGSTASRVLYRSTDDGRTWATEEATFRADENGHVPALHMAEHGIPLREGPNAGRLVRPARVYLADLDGERGYNTAIYSDDGGDTWHASAPFPVRGTGEGAIAELSNGDLLYSSRKHYFEEDEAFRHGRLHAWSTDGGETWGDPVYDETLPDGPRYRGEDGRGANHNGHFGMAGGLVRLPMEDEDILLYSNADNDGYQRKCLTVWASFDGGRTWPVKRLVDGGWGAYSSLAAGRPGTESDGWVYLQFEYGERGDPDAGEEYATIAYTGSKLARFTLGWVVRGERTGDGDLPDWAVP